MAETGANARRAPWLFLTAFVIATAGLVYELVAGTLASYVLGDSVRHFSTIIGAYLSAMGLGAYLSRFVKDRLAERFVEIELATALVGGLSAPFLFFVFARAEHFEPLLYAEVVAVGTLVGLELPLLMRILEHELDFANLVSKVLTFDYVGSLAGSVTFALFFVPSLGLVRTSVTFGALNAAVAMLSTYVLADRLSRRRRIVLRAQAVLLFALLLGVFVGAESLTRLYESELFGDPIVASEQTPYQRIVITAHHGERQLFLNGNLQFSTVDEYRYHEALVHPAFAAAPRHRRVLVLGGGDGLAVREILRHPDVESVTLVELDPAMIRLANTSLRELNGGSLRDPRVTVVNEDAMVYLDRHVRQPFDVVIVDFPDPNNFSLGKLYTSWFYRLLYRATDDASVVVVQSTSPLYARRSFWCVDATLRSVGFRTAPYHAFVPSFGEWGFVLARRVDFAPPHALDISRLRYLDDAVLASLFVFGPDLARIDAPVNRLDDQRLVALYEDEWNQWN